VKIEILGPGCPKCKRTFEVVSKFVQSRGLPHEVVKVESIEAMINYGLLSSPAIVIDGKVEIKGKVPSDKDLEKIIK
jgi:small redox-active disulfide protein 2